MTRRVNLGALGGGNYGLRVSRPGADVLSGSLQPKQVAFDSRWLRAERVFMMGRVITAGGGSSVTVNFGVTFAVPPRVFIMRKGGAVSGSHPDNLYWTSEFGWPNQVAGGWTGNAFSFVSIFTNRIVFAAPQFGSQQDFEYLYLVLRP